MEEEEDVVGEEVEGWRRWKEVEEAEVEEMEEVEEDSVVGEEVEEGGGGG